MHLDLRGTVLQIIGAGNGLAGKLALLPHQYEGLMQIIGNRSTKHEASGLCSYDHVEIHAVQQSLHGVNGQMKAVRILQYGCDIAENNSLLREIRYASDVFFNLLHVSSSSFLFLLNFKNKKLPSCQHGIYILAHYSMIPGV